MNYPQALNYLNSFLNLERILFQPNNRLWNLARMRLLLEWFDHPEKKVSTVLIAGTKGKGSTGFFLESILASAGIRTGFYSSPHLEDPRERIRIQRKKVSEADWARAVSQIKRRLGPKHLPEKLGAFTYFEILTLLAVLLFKEAGVEAGIFEVGMGGRLDATNALGANVVILTPVHMDHEAILGNTIARIAAEKAAVVHPGASVVLSPQLPEALRVIQTRIRKQKARLYPVRQGWQGEVGLKGDFQKINAAAAAMAAGVLRTRGFQIPEQALRKGLQASDWPGRIEVFPGALGPKRNLLIDGAHNPASIQALVRNLKGLPPFVIPAKARIHFKTQTMDPRSGFSQPSERVRGGDKLVIFGTSRDKNSAEMLKILGSFFKNVILCRNPNPRSQEIGALISQARPWFQRIFPAASVFEALEMAGRFSKPGDLTVATGSFYLIGEIRRKIKQKLRNGFPLSRE